MTATPPPSQPATLSQAPTEPPPPRRRRTLGLRLYQWITRLAAPLAPRLLNARARKGKEDPARLRERLGEPSLRRPDGPMIWLHGASVGESLMLLIVLDALRRERPDMAFLVTSGTRTSAQLLTHRLPKDAVHQYVPVDTPAATAAFLDHWRPSIGVFAESELWPNLILAAEARAIPLALINARMTDRSLQSWTRWRGALRRLFQGFVWIGAADTRTSEGLAKLLDRPVERVGNLKLAGAAPEPNPAVVESLKDAIGQRSRVWLAASTQPGEDAPILQAHTLIRETQSDALLILAPRHPERGPDIADMARQEGLLTARRGAGDLVDVKTSVYVADTLGEMGNWYAFADAAFIAGSWNPAIGGHTPLEAARAGAPLFTGPHVPNFADIYADLTSQGGVETVSTPQELAGAILALDNERAESMARGARAVADAGALVLNNTLAGLRPHLPEPVLERHNAGA